MTEQHLHRTINLQPEEGLSFFLFSPNQPIQDGIIWNNWESMLGAISVLPGTKEILLDPGTSGGTVIIPVRDGEVTSVYDLTGIQLRGARTNTVVDVSNVQLDGLETATNCIFANPTTTISTFVTPVGTSRSYTFDLCGFVQGPVAATASMFDIDGTSVINSINGVYSAAPGGLDLFDVDAAGVLTIGSFGSNNFGGPSGSASIFGGATPATIGLNTDDVYFAANQTTPATLNVVDNLDVALGDVSPPSTAAWGGPGVPLNYLDAVNRIANFVSGIHGPIP